MELVVDPMTNNTICQVQYSTVLYSTVLHSTVTNDMFRQETWAKLPRLVYGGFTNITQFVVPFTTIIIR